MFPLAGGGADAAVTVYSNSTVPCVLLSPFVYRTLSINGIFFFFSFLRFCRRFHTVFTFANSKRFDRNVFALEMWWSAVRYTSQQITQCAECSSQLRSNGLNRSEEKTHKKLYEHFWTRRKHQMFHRFDRATVFIRETYSKRIESTPLLLQNPPHTRFESGSKRAGNGLVGINVPSTILRIANAIAIHSKQK